MLGNRAARTLDKVSLSLQHQQFFLFSPDTPFAYRCVGSRQLGGKLQDLEITHSETSAAMGSRGILARISSVFSLWTTKGFVTNKTKLPGSLGLGSLLKPGMGNTSLLVSLFSSLLTLAQTDYTSCATPKSGSFTRTTNAAQLQTGLGVLGSSTRHTFTNVASEDRRLFSSRLDLGVALFESSLQVSSSANCWSPQFRYLIRPGFLPFSAAATSFFDIFERFAGLSRSSERFGDTPRNSFIDRAFFFPTVDTLAQANLMYCSLFFYNLFEVASYFSDSANHQDITPHQTPIIYEESTQASQPAAALENPNRLDIFSEVFRGGAALAQDGNFQQVRHATTASDNSIISETSGILSDASCTG